MNEEEQLKANREYTTSCVIQTTPQFTVSPPLIHTWDTRWSCDKLRVTT